MTKSIVMVTESVTVGSFYIQLLTDLFRESISITTFCTDRDTLLNLPDADLYVIGATSSNIFGHVISLIQPEKNITLVALTFRKSQLQRLKDIPAGIQTMLVNHSVNMAIETIAEINRLGITHFDMVPGYPGMTWPTDIDMAITPGESQFVPDGTNQMIDLGNRVFNSDTITEIALKLGYTWFLKSEQYRSYNHSLAVPSESVTMLWSQNMRMENYLDILMGAWDIGIIGIDIEDNIFAVNAIAQAITGISREMLGCPLAQTVPQVHDVIRQQGQTVKVSKLIQIHDAYITMSTAPAFWQGDPVGCFILLQRFTEEEKRQHEFRLQLYQRGYKAKYTFDDIIGQCPPIVHTKCVAEKMAHTDSSILLTGESGTGKELFAHSIHQSSTRSSMPFVAINCAALPEALLESELFGYADGAFTGAKKGGKLGLFEYAHKGTLFLDEIEGMSPNLQIKLLRVLQEKEMMRVGGDRMITIDVRIIAASNENILDMVQQGTFRRDLYYRINTLPINIPPLRERGDDLFLIMDAIQHKLGARFQLSAGAKEVFRTYPWDGNVRELINIVEYLRFADTPVIELVNLPQIMTARISRKESHPLSELKGHADVLSENDDIASYHSASQCREEAFNFVLRVLGENDNIGRGYLCKAATEQGLTFTDQEIRGILHKLNSLGLVSVSRGRGGSRLTQRGRFVLANM